MGSNCCCCFSPPSKVSTSQCGRSYIYEQEGYVIQVVDEDSLDKNIRDYCLNLLGELVPGSAIKQKNPTSVLPKTQAMHEDLPISTRVENNSYQASKLEDNVNQEEIKLTKDGSKVNANNRELLKDKKFIRLSLQINQQIIRHIQDNQKKFKHIPKHNLGDELDLNSENAKLFFRVKIQQGDLKFQSNKNTLNHDLWQNRPKERINFIHCLIQGILEIEKEDLFHLDLTLKNIIRKAECGQFIYKIIDFGYAFKVRDKKGDCPIFKCTKEIIKFLLARNFNDFIEHLFWRYQDIDKEILGRLIKIWNSIKPVDKQVEIVDEKVMLIVDELANFSLRSHKAQFVFILQQILEVEEFQQIKGVISNTDIDKNSSQWYQAILKKVKECVT